MSIFLDLNVSMVLRAELSGQTGSTQFYTMLQMLWKRKTGIICVCTQ